MGNDPRAFTLESWPGCRFRATGLPDLNSCAAVCAALLEHEAFDGEGWAVTTPEGETVWGMDERRDHGGSGNDTPCEAHDMRWVAAEEHSTLSALSPPNWPSRPPRAEGGTDAPEGGDAGEGAA
jgi:hypothetical protein